MCYKNYFALMISPKHMVFGFVKAEEMDNCSLHLYAIQKKLHTKN